ncbi:signal transduction histidine kinase chea [hydrocarbon metagenome]|uniref:Chemotaxis protein CheA n=1 Tax=hydrocarbon metagenome TaxID=938273 RepID=A0A0W8F452_9ZZZZ
MSELDAYRSLYVAESRENLENIVKNLLVLEEGSDVSAIAEIFRSAHSLKGMSASMGFVEMEQLCHAMEDIFQSVRNNEIQVDAAVIDLLLAAADDIEVMVDDIESGGSGNAPDMESHLERLRSWTSPSGKTGPGIESAPGEPGAGIRSAGGSYYAGEDEVAGVSHYCLSIGLDPSCVNKNLRGMIILQNLDALGEILDLFPARDVIEDGEYEGAIRVTIRSDCDGDVLVRAAQVSEVSEVRLHSDAGGAGLPTLEPEAGETSIAGPREELPVEPKDEAALRPDKGREVKNIRVDISRLDHMMNLVEDLVINRGRVIQIAQQYQMKELDETLNMIGRSVIDLQDLMMNIRMIPLSHIFNRFPRTVRDLSQKKGKEVELVITGGETELDRSVMDGLNDPLLHLVRNAIDHGIELPREREKSGKQRKGLIRLSARRDRDNVIIAIEDDGAGIDPERVLKKALERGIISREQAGALSKEEIYDLIFLPGFSTADQITDVSGRGVGMDVVRTAISSLKGSIKIHSNSGSGTRFELMLPPTMAIVDVMIVRLNSRRCAIPVTNIVEVASLDGADIHTISNQEMVLLRDEVMPLDRLDDMFGTSPASEILVVLQTQQKKRAIVVDLIEGQQEVVIKPLASIVGVCRGIGGVTIPGDGQVVPVLDVDSIVLGN